MNLFLTPEELGDWSIVRDYNTRGFALYNPWVEGDALYIKFDTFANLVGYLRQAYQAEKKLHSQKILRSEG